MDCICFAGLMEFFSFRGVKSAGCIYMQQNIGFSVISVVIAYVYETRNVCVSDWYFVLVVFIGIICIFTYVLGCFSWNGLFCFILLYYCYYFLSDDVFRSTVCS
jgi:hypothetical protein